MHLVPVACATLLSLSSSLGSATTIVGIRTPEAVVIAADSEQTMKGGTKPQGRRTGTKIFVESGTVYAIGNIAGDPSRKFDAARTIATSLRNAKNLDSAVTKLDSELTTSLEQLLPRFRVEEPALFNDIMRGAKDGEYVTLVLLASFQNGQPVTIFIGYAAVVDRSGAVAIKSKRLACPGDCPTGTQTFFLGSKKAIDKYVAEKGKNFDMPPQEAARFLVQLEIDSGTPGVGPPIEVIVVDKTGVRWVNKGR